MVQGKPLVVVGIKTRVMPGPVLIFGGRGMLGSDLVSANPGAVSFGRDLDITDREAVIREIADYRPRVVINAAAYTDVDGCEDNREHAMDVNGRAPGFIAEACCETGAILVHFSTDYVFDGEQEEYRESDRPNPVNVYGRSKLLGEENIRKATDDFRIVRTSWLFGRNGRNFVETMIALSRKEEVIRVVNDQFGKPTYARDLAAAIPEVVSAQPGIFHLTNEGRCSWFEFASAIIPNAVPCSSGEYVRKARRPKFSVLCNTRISRLRPWRAALGAYLEERERKS
jgi:dTDP-4-dehydrorhamnose reductase